MMKNILSAMSLRFLMVLLVGLLVAAALAFAIGDLQQSRINRSNALLLVERNNVADLCLQSVKNFAFERGRSNVVLRGRDPIGQENRRFIDDRRAEADKFIGEVLERLPENFRAKGEEVRHAWEQVQVLRPVLEHDFSLYLVERDPALQRRWLAAANELIDKLESLLIHVSSVLSGADANFERLSNLRIFVLQFRNLVGTEAATLATELSSGRVPEHRAVDAVNRLRGKSQQIWLQLERGVESLADNGPSAALDKVRAELFGRLRPMQDEIIKAAETGQIVPVSIEDYLAAAVPALDATISLADDISRAATAYTKKNLEATRNQEMISLGSIVAILMLAAFVVMLLEWRFTRPLNEIMGRINRLRGVQSTMVAFPPMNGDEFARIRQALELLSEAMEAHLRSEEALHESERINASILASTPLSIIVTDVDGTIRVFSPGAEALLGYLAEEVVGKQTPLFFHDPKELRVRANELSKESGDVVEPDFNVIVAGTAAGAKPVEREWTYIRKDGARMTVLLSIALMRNVQGEVLGYLGVASDITERKRIATEMSLLAYYDHLTQLPNRRLFHDRLQMAITQAKRERGHLALMLIDLDKFKPVNDSFGHSVGDLLLKAVAKRMQACLRESDTLARLGGDEFVAILPSIGEAQAALGVAEKIRLELNEPFELTGGYTVSIACSIGVAIYPEHGKDEKHLLKSADDAMYAAKDHGRNRVEFFSDVSKRNTRHEARGHNASIVRLVWHKSYRCGEASIDREHNELFERANALMHACMSGEKDLGQMHEELDDLISSVARHFENEEAVLARYNYPELEEHTAKHQRLIERALELRRLANVGELTLGDLVTFIVQEIVVRHLLKEDKKFFPLLKEALKNERNALS